MKDSQGNLSMVMRKFGVVCLCLGICGKNNDFTQTAAAGVIFSFQPLGPKELLHSKTLLYIVIRLREQDWKAHFPIDFY